MAHAEQSFPLATALWGKQNKPKQKKTLSRPCLTFPHLGFSLRLLNSYEQHLPQPQMTDRHLLME